VGAYGSHIRQALSKCSAEAAELSQRLSQVLESSWNNKAEILPVNVEQVIQSFKPKSYLLSEVTEEYLSLRQIDEIPPRTAVDTCISLAGDRDVADYTREDAKLFVHHLSLKGNKTATIRRRINSLSAILNYAYAELDLDKRNPFTRLIIKNEGDDVSKRGTFTNEQLLWGYEKALASNSQIKILMPLLGETGCRLAEIVGLELQDIDMEQELIHIRPNSIRKLKTKNSERTLPLVGHAKIAMEQALKNSDQQYLVPRYIREGKCKSDHASAALGKWLKRDFNGLTAHCLRHTFRDRLRAVECPLELIDQIGGWSSISSVGSSYGVGYDLKTIKKYLLRCSISVSKVEISSWYNEVDN
jgi:integrase